MSKVTPKVTTNVKKQIKDDLPMCESKRCPIRLLLAKKIIMDRSCTSYAHFLTGMESTTSVREFYKGRNVLVTGGTGFMGKVLIEKMLYSIPDIGNIFILIRPKKGKSVVQRLEDMQRLPVSTTNRLYYHLSIIKVSDRVVANKTMAQHGFVDWVAWVFGFMLQVFNSLFLFTVDWGN